MISILQLCGRFVIKIYILYELFFIYALNIIHFSFNHVIIWLLIPNLWKKYSSQGDICIFICDGCFGYSGEECRANFTQHGETIVLFPLGTVVIPEYL